MRTYCAMARISRKQEQAVKDGKWPLGVSMSSRTILGLLVMLGLWTMAAEGKGTGQAAQSDGAGLSGAEAAKRDGLLEPGVELMRKGDAAGAFAALQPALAAYPKDLQVLRYAGDAALAAGKNEAALALFERALATHPAQSWPLRLAVIRVQAKLGNWAEFTKDLAELKAAKKDGGDAQLARADGFLVDEFEVSGLTVEVEYFPLLAGKYKTLYRFLLPVSAARKSGDGPGCEDAQFRPYLDVESDDADQAGFQKRHPELAAKGERSYSLDTYPGPCSQGLIKFYWEGEPGYAAVKGDVERYVAAAVK
jgi:tetratricopeptide (TPR) repeat protein